MTIQVGNRNSWLHGKAKDFLVGTEGVTIESLTEALIRFNQNLDVPLPTQEVRAVAHEIWRNKK